MKHVIEYLDENLRERYEERAAIMHYEGGLPKEKADALALAELGTVMKHRKAIEAKKEAA